MASILRRRTGGVAIQFLDLRGKRRTLGLGSAPERFVKRAAEVVDDLLDAARFGQPVPAGVVAWLGGLNDETFERFVAAGLVIAREKRDAVPITVAEHAKAYLARWAGGKHSTRLVLGHVVRNLGDYFQTTALGKVTAGDCDDFSRWLSTSGRTPKQVQRKGAGLSPATIGKRLQWCSSIFRDAVRRGLIPSNPFGDVKKPGATNEDRQQYVPAEVIETLIAAERDPEWRALMALARYQGVRTPSEPFSLVWSDIDWERKRIRIPSPKTEVHGKAYRLAPILPEVLPHLEALYAIASEGSLYVFSKLRERDSTRSAEKGLWANVNLRTALLRKLEKAGITPWPKLWHALRASAQTDLSARFPTHVVAGWLGNTTAVALKHYLMTTDADFDRASTGGALQSALQSGRELRESGGNTPPENAKNPRKTEGFASFSSGERT